MIIKIGNFAFNIEKKFYKDDYPCLIWSHGLISCIESDDSIGIIDFEKISQVTNLTRFDTRSHGDSEIEKDYLNLTWEQSALDLISIADYFKLERFSVGGTSMGAGIALWVASLVPDRVDKLILHMAPDAWEMRKGIEHSYHNTIKKIHETGLTTALDLLKNSTHDFLHKHQINHDKMIDKLGTFGQDIVVDILKGAAISNFPNRKRLVNFTRPVLILPWENLEGHSVKISNELAGMFSEATLNVAKNTKQAFEHTDLIVSFLSH